MKLPYIIALVGALGVSASAAALVIGGSQSGTTSAATASTSDIITMSIPPRHTMEDMFALSDGMTYDDAARTLGTPGHLQTRKMAGIPGVEDDPRVDVYAWPNADGSRIILVFRSDRLFHRTQVGMR